MEIQPFSQSEQNIIMHNLLIRISYYYSKYLTLGKCRIDLTDHKNERRQELFKRTILIALSQTYPSFSCITMKQKLKLICKINRY